ncbi:hypothetical protein ACF1DY_01725 [Streptomyces albus]
MSAEHEIRTVANTIAAAALGWNSTGRKPSELYHAMAVRLHDAGLILTPEKAAELAAAPRIIYRAEHDSIVMGLYTTAAEARAHCVAEERRSWVSGESIVFDWIEDEEDSIAELVTVAEDGETVTGYVVTALEVATEYDEAGEKDTQQGESTPDFFQPGRTYCNGDGYTAPELLTIFRVECVTRHPSRGTLRAIGWSRSGAPDATWHGNFRDEGDFEGWHELRGGEPA